MSLSLESDYINFDFPYDYERRENIYPCLIDEQPLTVVIGAKCSDGIVLIADRKLTRKNGEITYREKIFGDLPHVLIGYTGDVQMFDIFRRYTVGDLMIERDAVKRYTLDNLLSKVSSSIKDFNRLVESRPFKVLMVSHHEKPLELYHIDESGNPNISDYKAIGSGKEIADIFCGALKFDKILMREFIRHAYLAIMYMDKYCPGFGVGVEPEGNPDIKYLYYDQEWDKEPAKESPQDIEDCKNYTDKKLKRFREQFDVVLKEP